MALHFPYEAGLPPNTIAVGVDMENKNSQHAVKWVIDVHAMQNCCPLIVLLHVNVKRNLENQDGNEVVSRHMYNSIFAPFRGYCNRKQVKIKVKEILIEADSIEKGVLDFIYANKIVSIVIGAQIRDPLAKAKKNKISKNNSKYKKNGNNNSNNDGINSHVVENDAPLDLQSSLFKHAPDFCSVYVISKGKVMQIRTGVWDVPESETSVEAGISSAMPPKLPFPIGIHPQKSPNHRSGSGDSTSCRGMHRGEIRTLREGLLDYCSASDDSARGVHRGERRILGGSERIPLERTSERMPSMSISERTPSKRMSEKVSSERMSERMLELERRKGPPINTLEYMDASNQERNSSNQNSSCESDATEYNSFGSIDMTGHNFNISPSSSESSRSDSKPGTKDVEAEMRRLKLELRQTMDMYSSACKEALSAKRKAKQLEEWKMEEARRFEEARLAEEAALATSEVEKAKCRAAIEAAEAAHRLAEMEVQGRRYAELKAKREVGEKNRALTVLHQNDMRYRKYTIEEIEVATEKFASYMKVGEGGYGPVFKGRLDHTEVAIKILRPDAAQGRKQFQQEIEVLSSMRHPNMVLLLGACPEYGCLVYEYLNNGSLEDRLLRRGGTPTLSWRMRFKIAVEIATALLFLHQAKPEPLVHRDLKPGNILLDRHYVSKISDVGLARLVPPSVADSVTQSYMTSAAGTFYYIDPEYQQTGRLGTKSDIYSFGVVLLQIITARPPMALSHHVERSIKNGTFADMLDPSVHDWPIEEALRFAKVALKCCEIRKRDRPDLGSYVLPELRRLWDFGNNFESNSSSGYGQGPHSY